MLEEFINCKEEYLKLDYFAKKLGVSTRTIRNDIKNLEKDYKKNGFYLEYKTRLGYILKIVDKENFEKYFNELPVDIVESPEQRIDSLIVELLLKDGYRTIENLSEQFLISVSQMKNDLKKVDEKLAEYKIEIERKPHYGIKVKGSIEDIQEVLRVEYSKLNRNFMEYRMEFIDKTKLIKIKSIVNEILKKYEIEINITELEELLAHIIILYIKTGIREKNDSIKLEKKEENQVLGEILKNVFKEKRYYFTQRENDYLRNLIKSKIKNTKMTTINVDKNKLKRIMHDYFSEIDKRYKTNLLDEEEFLKLLYIHILALIDRSKRNQSVSNPFSEKISQQYPTVFNLAIQLSKIIEKEYDIKIDQNEIGFIATHIAVPFEKRQKDNFNKKYKIAIVCSSGGGSAFLIKIRLSEIFPNAEIENFSLLDERDVISFDPDIIFSIRELSFKTKAPVVLINEILDDLDNLSIKESVMLVDSMSDIKNPKDYILSLFNKNNFRCIKDSKDYKELLYSMAQEIVDEGICSETYPDDVWEREECLSTIYKNGVAIPHPIEMTGSKNIISVGLVQASVKGTERVPKIIFMISLIKGNLEIHKQISKYLDKIMNSKELVDMLNKSQSYEEFIYKLKIYIGG
ncbi:BglG family transcription antiterminator [Peptacetobacter sp.]|uniref:BglG family transcription antiterminator n=1 Tax=Peptacetobacter sp. TaxID=2991975 RepID=UPI002605A555|nr:BglG family transcription antiterminator [Peptacetobacter sp.]